jgi:hypothetical protein
MLVRRGSIRSLVEGSYEIGAWFHAGHDPLQADGRDIGDLIPCQNDGKC